MADVGLLQDTQGVILLDYCLSLYIQSTLHVKWQLLRRHYCITGMPLELETAIG